MKEYVIFGITEEDLRDFGEHGLNRRFRLIFNNGYYSHMEVKLTPDEAVKMRRQFRKTNRKSDYHYELFLKEAV